MTPSVFGGLDIRDADKDGDDELVIGASRKLWATVGLGGLPFDLTSLDVEAFSFDPLDPRGGKSQGLIVTSPEGDYIQITSTGTVTLNWTAVTSVRISIDAGRRVGSPTGTIDNIILNGGGKGNNGKKAEKASVCHVSGDGSTNIINVNGNAVAAHLAHGDTLAIDHKGQLICKPVKPPGPQK